MKSFVFTVDDNIWFLRDLSVSPMPSLFDHPYMAMWRGLHERYGMKIQLNLFFATEGFTLRQMTDRYKQEFEANSDWLKLSFHSKTEFPRAPYKGSPYGEIFDDCREVNEQIIRFSGEHSLAKTTTVHYCMCTEEGVRALKDIGIRGLIGLFGNEEAPRRSYHINEQTAQRLRRGEIVLADGIRFFNIDVVLNQYSEVTVLERLKTLAHRDFVEIMIHEQYFYPYYHAYQSDYSHKVESSIALLTELGFVSRHAEELL